MTRCTHRDAVSILEAPAQVAGCEDRSWCYVDELMMRLAGR